MRKLGLWLAILLVVGTTGARAQTPPAPTLDLKALQKVGVDTRTFSLVRMSEDGHQLMGWDRPPVNLKRKGEKIRIWLLDFDSAFKPGKAQSFPLDIPNLEQCNYTADGQALVVITRVGADFLRVDLKDGKVSTIMSHVQGQPGFRCSPSLLTVADGKLYVEGYFYDATGAGDEVILAELDPSKTGVAAFTAGPAVQSLEWKIPNLLVSITDSPKAMFFFGHDEKSVTLYCWTPDKGLQPVDTGVRVKGLWGEQHRLAYSIVKSDQSSDLVIFDGQTGTKKVVGTTPKPLDNLDLGRYGQTITGCQNDGKGNMTLMMARDKDNFEMKPAFTGLPLGVARLAPSGDVLALYAPFKGLYILPLP